ncbi:TPA: hypothetical protein SUX92_002002, partial [Streptococcus equi subsp. equi]|nr:hypothetical protein [Streptococcus equi subsp. equi]
NDKYMCDYGISDENVLKQWKDICFGIFTRHKVKKELIKEFLLKTTMTEENNNEQ